MCSMYVALVCVNISLGICLVRIVPLHRHGGFPVGIFMRGLVPPRLSALQRATDKERGKGGFERRTAQKKRESLVVFESIYDIIFVCWYNGSAPRAADAARYPRERKNTNKCEGGRKQAHVLRATSDLNNAKGYLCRADCPVLCCVLVADITF